MALPNKRFVTMQAGPMTHAVLDWVRTLVSVVAGTAAEAAHIFAMSPARLDDF